MSYKLFPKNMRKILIPLFFLTTLIPVNAQTASGGGAYIQNNGKLINCIITGNYAVNGFGVSGTSGSNVVNCNITGNLYLSTQIVNPGDMVMSDGSVYTPQYTNGNLIFSDGHTANDVVGVCFWTNENNDFVNAKSWVIAVTENNSITWTPTVQNQQVDITTPYASSDLFNYATPTGAIEDIDGLGNTAKIVSDYRFIDDNAHGTYLQTTTNCAAKYCNQYNSQVGVWFLPSLGQLSELYANMSITNNTLTSLKKTRSSVTLISASSYWSSTEWSSTGAWTFNFSTGYTVGGNKQDPKIARAMKIIGKSN